MDAGLKGGTAGKDFAQRWFITNIDDMQDQSLLAIFVVQSHNFLDAIQGHGRRIDQIIDHDHIVASLQQIHTDMGANESCSSRHEDTLSFSSVLVIITITHG